MAKFKDTELELTRERDEMRDVEVELNFTPNALASVLYKQGETVVLACCTRARTGDHLECGKIKLIDRIHHSARVGFMA